MKINSFKALTLFALIILVVSCSDSSTATLTKWKNQNDTYFANMKDSVGWTFYSIPGVTGVGYYYKIKKAGNVTNISPTTTDNVTVNYKGSMITGDVFDRTYNGTSPLTDTGATPRNFVVNQLIPGWTYNLMQMKVGEIRSIVLPQQLGYGEYGSGSILPYTVTLFDMQLISVNK